MLVLVTPLWVFLLLRIFTSTLYENKVMVEKTYEINLGIENIYENV